MDLLSMTPTEFDEIEASAMAMAKSKAATNGLVFTSTEELAVNIGIHAGVMAALNHIKQKRDDNGL